MRPAWRRWLLVRRSVRAPTDLPAFVVLAPQATTLAEAGQVAGARWSIASSVEAAKGEVGLEQYEVRSGTGWYRHSTLAMWAYALLTVVRARHLPAGVLPKKMLVQAPPHRLAACKAARNCGAR
jgi:SRSO17 transposase